MHIISLNYLVRYLLITNLVVHGFLNRYLATGDSSGESLRSLSFAFRISHCYLSNIVRNTLLLLKTKLVPRFLKSSNTIDFKQKAEEFAYKWNFPNCIAAIDGKHIRVRSPSNSGSLFHNYKDFFDCSSGDGGCKL